MKLRDYVAKQRSKKQRPGISFLALGLFWNALNFVRGRKSFSLMRFLRANRLSHSAIFASQSEVPPIEILFVCSGEDIEMLPHVIPAAAQAVIGDFSPKISVIVPEEVFPRCVESLSSVANLVVLNEEDFFPQETLEKIRGKFGSRFGWALQQLLKVKYVFGSTAAGVLIVDADTLLIEPRIWLDSDHNQILTPTDEYNRSYYEYLSAFNLSEHKPKFTFVSHHMLLQPFFLKQAFHHAGWTSVDDLIESSLRFDFSNQTSPFSIDYELYAQFMSTVNPNKICFSKWANIAVQREHLINAQVPREFSRHGGSYSSISFHGYL